jgi:septal ring factor EnvC (AmiA/AmiB activator)
MNDTSKSATANAQTAQPDLAPTTGDGREPLPRGTYVTLRLEEIAARVGEMVGERQKLTAVLKAPPGQEGAPHKELRQRLAYLAQRLVVIRQEQAELAAEKRAAAVAERKAAAAAERQGGGGGKKKNPTATTAQEPSRA